MQTILLTGGTGYLGSHLARGFVEAGHRVAVLTRNGSSQSRLGSLLPGLEIFNTEEGLDRPFRALGHVHAVVHAATCYGRDGETAFEVFEANTAFPLRLLETATHFGVERFFNTDTILNEYVNAYALSKHQFSEWGRSFADAGALKFINIRLEHLYGAGDDDNKFTTHVIRSCLRNVPEISLTPGEQKRDFVYVDDVVRAYACLLEKGPELAPGFHQFGIGSGKSVSIREFANKVHQLTKSRSTLMFGALPYRKNEVMQSQADISGLAEIGWCCQLSLEQGLQLTIDAEMQS